MSEDAVASGEFRLPTAHVVRAAAHVAQQIDAGGSAVASLRQGYSHYSTNGRCPPEDLLLGERLLLDLGLLVESEGVLRLRDGFLPAAEAAEGVLVETVFLTAASAVGDAELVAGLSEEVVATVDGLVVDVDRREALLLA